ncbi:uncharacterized protein LOC143041334 [Oratosquilla oratoria]|uniref:uncharacterized protein LOC143041334 n=1 Tax=Oratosquilla oratoria TaxID=337810 RepID=UPI003F76E487
MATSFSIDRILSIPTSRTLQPSIPHNPQRIHTTPSSFPSGLNPMSFYSAASTPKTFYPAGSPQGTLPEIRHPHQFPEDSERPKTTVSRSSGEAGDSTNSPKNAEEVEVVVSGSDEERKFSSAGLSIARPVPRRAVTARSTEPSPLDSASEDLEDPKARLCQSNYTSLGPPSSIDESFRSPTTFRSTPNCGMVTSIPVTQVNSGGPLRGRPPSIDDLIPRTTDAALLAPGAMSTGVIGAQRTSSTGVTGLNTTCVMSGGGITTGVTGIPSTGAGVMNAGGVPVGVTGVEAGVRGIPVPGAGVMPPGVLGAGVASSHFYRQLIFQQFLEAQCRVATPLPFSYYPLFDYSAFPSPRRLPRRGGQIRFTGDQTKELEAVFDQHKYITPSRRKDLARNIHLDEKQVKTWFQNRRAKWRKTRAMRRETTVIEEEEEEEERKRLLGEESGEDDDFEINDSNRSTRT